MSDQDRNTGAGDGAGARGAEADRRLEADAELVAMLRKEGDPNGRAARDLAQALGELGVGALSSMARNGRLFGVLSQRGRGLERPPSEYFDEEQSLIFMSVGVAVQRFMNQEIYGCGWSPTKGASVQTWFVGACLDQFANEYRRFRAQRRTRDELIGDNLDLLEKDGGARGWSRAVAAEDPALTVLDRMELEHILDQMYPLEREIVLLVGQGWSRQEVSRELGISNRKVRSTLERLRDRLSLRREGERADRSVSEAANPAASSVLWRRLSTWGINDAAEAVRVKELIDAQRKVYENPERFALYRPIPGDDRNQLDIVLDGMRSDVHIDNQKKWTADSARVCREVLKRVQEVVPSVSRPGSGKGSSAAMRELYQSLKIVSDSRVSRRGVSS
ncbi:sigma factor-like helix-turn-helix DNA-binding protein [Actinomycetospora atypica]|uniref:Sigma factor-like helix-turn-helix DNA-binding protein n=1 Tax=Actinomycetospora atypica TaxID=1290095 RepID=A0ABV9YNP0_9PSEU